MQVLDRRKAMSITPLFRLAFRPFFLGGCLLALLAIPLWLLALAGDAGWQPAGGWLAWHRHELLFGFALAIIGGFLLTAVQTWTGRPGISGMPLALLAGVWLGARLAWLGNLPWPLLAVLELSFPLAVAGLMGWTLWKVRQQRNYPIVLVLLLLTLADGLSLYGLLRADEGWQRQAVLSGLWLVAAMMGLIGGRVIPFFTQRGLGRTEAVKPWPWLDHLLLGGSAGVALLYASGLALTASLWVGLLFGLLGLGHLLRLVRWHDRGLWRVPLLWSLHLAYAWLAVACLGMALWHFGAPLNPSLAVHALTVGAMGGLILAMIARVSLGHTGRPLTPPKGMPLAFALLNLACLSRVLLVLVWPYAALWLAGLCWTLGLGLYLWRYAPMLWRARVDGHPG
ncbi:short-chain dehydrogenase [Pseudomonas gessardii]|uniref:Short-chain dehydrogenase n=1 Tax=Pseudomonas gessardii TaxID=78544 RepID=A0ABS9EZV9_9PSED|nr:NnrS family protein [Pseudomonas gessardii]MCF4980118.1 short-chain dehydrogenase [Pseudomonas gessardii]MCF4991771.1 short-chain dehydrogenase [Pseudomonas gessardii]MCF5085598.1 short-chain dehydrogenase [Pseudomonas gessardii]MCF5097957.1 short-chain dehydrogenase [Pseudomonas gessardii]MCF5105714.1 short-chain dehydrogenase [Pseudomonas gessardii]